LQTEAQERYRRNALQNKLCVVMLVIGMLLYLTMQFQLHVL